jgi:hypothetical protein
MECVVDVEVGELRRGMGRVGELRLVSSYTNIDINFKT